MGWGYRDGDIGTVPIVSELHANSEMGVINGALPIFLVRRFGDSPH